MKYFPILFLIILLFHQELRFIQNRQNAVIDLGRDGQFIDEGLLVNAGSKLKIHFFLGNRDKLVTNEDSDLRLEPQKANI